MADAPSPPSDQTPQVLYEEPAPGVARIVMNRPERRNAQGVVMTHELDDAFRRACHDDKISVIILAGAGDHFNAGHDLGIDEAPDPTAENARSFWGQFQADGWEGTYSREHDLYLDACERWRNAPKPIIAEVQGAVVTGGMTLVWACDLIVCSEDARFRDTTGHDLAIPGVEFFQHSYEMSTRQAKEWLFTGDWMDAETALKRGMINHVVPRENLSKATLDLAIKVAKTDRFTLKLIKESINGAQDAMGRREAMKYSFALHQIGHLHNMLAHGYPVDITRLSPSIQEKLRIRWKRHEAPSRA
jgi:enoyl-CoA hydratase